MRTTAEVTGAARISPTAPKSAPPRDRDDQDGERVDAERRAHRERLHQLLKHAVREQLDHDHADRGVGPGAAQRDQHREGARPSTRRGRGRRRRGR